jgi:DNA-binding Lrp family transcriptional regulator
MVIISSKCGGKLNKMKQERYDINDEKIINALMDNSKVSLRKLANSLRISIVTVMNRIRKLKKSGVIRGYCADIDHEKLGYGVNVMISMRVSKGKLLMLEKKIARSPNVYAVYDVTGEYDVVVLALFRSTRAMDNFLKKIQTYDFVERTNTRLILNTIKERQIMVKF